MLNKLTNIEFIELPGDAFVTGLLRDIAHVQIKNLASNTKDDYQYQVTNGGCPEEFKNNPKLLLCTSSLRFGSEFSVREYFEAWNILLSQ
jgi:hypothetical protein